MNWEKEKFNWPFWENSHFFETENCTWHYQVIGENSNPLLFMIHGAGASSHSWKNMVKLLSDYQIICVDLPGHRFSKNLKNKSLDLNLITSDLVKLSRRLKKTPSIYLGHSIGAVIALQLAYEINKIGTKTSAISINGALESFEGPAGKIFPLMAKAMSWSPLTKYWVKLFNSAENSLRKLLSLSGSNLTTEDIEPYINLMKNSDHIQGTLDLISNWDIETFKKILDKINFPILFIIGEKDGIVPNANSINANKKVKTSKLIKIANAGHLLHEEKSEIVAAEVRTFYKFLTI